jgi:hypothetical protein
MPVSPSEKVRSAHFTFIERSHGSFGTRFGCAFERHVVLPAEKCSEPASRPIVQQRNLDQNGWKGVDSRMNYRAPPFFNGPQRWQ